MPFIREKQKTEVEQEIVVGFVCNKCGERHDADGDFAEYQEAFDALISGGYGSVWGDGAYWSIVLCQRCAFQLLRPYAQEIDCESARGG